MKTESHARHDAEVQQRENDDLRRELSEAKWLLLGYKMTATSEQRDRAESMARVFQDAMQRVADGDE